MSSKRQRLGYKADVRLGELGEVIGDHWSMTLWGCAFEDFLTREVEGAGNIVDDYLKHRGWHEKATNKGFLSDRFCGRCESRGQRAT